MAPGIHGIGGQECRGRVGACEGAKGGGLA